MNEIIETKYNSGRITEVKEAIRNNVPVGLISGYISTWTPDDTPGMLGKPDKFHPGCWLKSLQDHRNRDNRQVRFKHQHHELIGGFPIDTVREDSKGLFGEGEVNLENQTGKEIYSLAKQGVLVDFSVRFTATDDRLSNDIRDIFEAILWEGSAVDEPQNKPSQITEVKSTFMGLPIADKDTEIPEASYKNCLLADGRYPISTMIDGIAMIVPKAIIAAAEGLMSDETLEPEDKTAAILHLERYFAKMDVKSPFNVSERQFFGVTEIKSMTKQDLEKALMLTGHFSKQASITLASKMDMPNDGLTQLLKNIKSIKI